MMDAGCCYCHHKYSQCMSTYIDITRLMPIIGQFQISDIARVSYILHERWGRIVRLGGLLGRPDLLFVYDADEIEKVFINIQQLRHYA